MPGWTLSTITELTNAIMILVIFLFGTFHGKIRKGRRRFPTMFLATALLGFLASFIRGSSYYLGDSFLHRLSWAFIALAGLCLIVWLEQIVFEVPRVIVRSTYTFLAGMSVAFSWVPENAALNVDGTPIWTGMWALSGQVFIVGLFIYLVVFFFRVGIKAPWKVRIPLAMILVLAAYLGYGNDLVRLFLPGTPGWVWPVLSGIATALVILLLIFVCVIFPEFLSIITYTLDRLIVIHAENGVLLFSHSWVKRKHDDVDLVAPLLQALQSMSFEVLKLGHMTELHLEEGNLMFQKSDHVIVGIISSRSTVYLRTRLSMFIDAFEIQFKADLDAFSAGNNNEISKFQQAKTLVEKIFQAIPLDTTRFGPWRRHLDEKDYLSPDEDPELIDDLKSLFSPEP